MVTPQLFQDIKNKMDKELLEFMDATNLINLTDTKSINDASVEEFILKTLEDPEQASLSADLWDPVKTGIAVNLLSQKRVSCDIEADIKFEDWQALKKQSALDAGLNVIGGRPAIQSSHYLIQGTKLTKSGVREPRPFVRAGAYNFMVDVGADNLASTNVRPIGCNQVTGTPNTWLATTGAWSTYANMATDANAVETLFANGFNRNTTYVIVPQVATPGLGKKRTTAGDGFRNFYMEMEDHKIPAERILTVDDRYCYTRAGAAPTNAAFDIIYVDMKSIRCVKTVDEFVNTYFPKPETKFPAMCVECGLTYIPIFKPKYNPSTSKWYKGVSIVRGVNAT